MSMGPLGIIGSAAGTPLAQIKGSDVDRAAQDTAAQARQTKADLKAEQAAGIGQTEEDQQTSDRDADGRRVWELGEEPSPEQEAAAEQADDEQTPRSKDPSGDRGRQLDLSG
ncbi:MAG: hypothetical protein RIC55_14745 [Pirellulaceae bacterium]